MTTKEYIKKYKLNTSNQFSHSDFVNDIKSDFLALLEMNNAIDNLKGFENALRCVNMKWDAIVNKTLGRFPEKLWNFFYATVVVKLREELCQRELQKRKALQESKRKEYERRKAEENRFFDEMFKERSKTWERIWSEMFIASVQSVPAAEFIVLGIKNIENVTPNDVKSAYRSLTIQHHPDKGGKQEDFIKITEAKNKCLAWLNAKTIA
jgi:hypothetical protein